MTQNTNHNATYEVIKYYEDRRTGRVLRVGETIELGHFDARARKARGEVKLARNQKNYDLKPQKDEDIIKGAKNLQGQTNPSRKEIVAIALYLDVSVETSTPDMLKKVIKAGEDLEKKIEREAKEQAAAADKAEKAELAKLVKAQEKAEAEARAQKEAEEAARLAEEETKGKSTKAK